ncbi:MAG: transcription elongation factor GreA [Saprospiraceae bacterium]|nr:transcription elongation factor GreA [Saprospiraceae bacterium]
MSKYVYLTKEGYEKLKADLEDLKTNGRAEAAKAIAEARDKGDLSENAEYDAAKDAQGMLEMKISEMETTFANARLIDTSQIDTSKVAILSKVTIKNKANNKQVTYQLVSETEANLKEKKISVDSPIGTGLLGKVIGDIAEVQTPAGSVSFEIIDIQF